MRSPLSTVLNTLSEGRSGVLRNKYLAKVGPIAGNAHASTLMRMRQRPSAHVSMFVKNAENIRPFSFCCEKFYFISNMRQSCD